MSVILAQGPDRQAQAPPKHPCTVHVAHHPPHSSPVTGHAADYHASSCYGLLPLPRAGEHPFGPARHRSRGGGRSRGSTRSDIIAPEQAGGKQADRSHATCSLLPASSPLLSQQHARLPHLPPSTLRGGGTRGAKRPSQTEHVVVLVLERVARGLGRAVTARPRGGPIALRGGLFA